MASRPVCKFWQQGNCKFGDGCRFDHPHNAGPRQNNNRFVPLNESRGYNESSSRDYVNDPRSHGRNAREAPKQTGNRNRDIDQDQLRKDLTNERPIWLLSCYSPRADLPKQLFEGSDRELSSEEVRLRHYELVAQDQMQVAIQEAEAVYQVAKNQTDSVLRDVAGAVKYLQAGFDEHPNRIDLCNSHNKMEVAGASNGFAQTGSATSTGQFGQVPASTAVSTFGQASGTPAFGQASGLSAFGRPSGIAPVSTFGQPSNNAPISEFGQSSTLGAASAFGKPSAMGVTSAFGQPSALGGNTAFGQPSTLPQKPVFGQTAIPSQSAFGQPSGLGGKAAFGQPSGSGAKLSPFGQSAQATTAAFGQPSNPFAQQRPAGSTATFTQTNGLFARKQSMDSSMQMSPSQGSFGAPSSTIPRSSTGFGQSNGLFGQSSVDHATSDSGVQRTSSISGGFGQTSTNNSGFGASSQRTPNITRNPVVNGTQGKLQNWKGKQVRYIGDQPCYQEKDGTWQRIWFADGPPTWAKPEILPSDLPYDAEVEDRYLHAKQSGYFKDGIIPLLPPKREWTSWEF